jgi:thiol-disulfide isomerase/thioredoxin
MLHLRLHAILGFALCVLALPAVAHAQPTVRQALGLSPMQRDVEYDRPADNEIDRCNIQPERDAETRAWVVVDPAGNMLRRFTDTNGDNKIDRWCYFRGGVEVYRDIDADFNEKADQYRWFATGGSRWGLDRDEDGTIDDWKWISPEEVTAELVRALATRDAKRFETLLAQDEELKAAGLADELVKQLTAQAAKARQEFGTFAETQKHATEQSTWVDFSAPLPGAIPAGNEQTAQDLIVYENVIALIDTGGQHGELPVGTLLRIADRWRLIGLPNRDDSGFFFRVADRRTLPVANVPAATDAKTQQLVQKLEELDKQLTRASTPDASTKVYEQRIAVLRELIAASAGEERDMWLLQLIDSVVAIAQPSQNSEGVKLLSDLASEVASATQNKEIVAQARFSFLTAEYSDQLQKPDANLPKIQEKWIADLKAFVAEFESSRSAAEAMLQLAISEEFAGEDDEAQRLYAKIVQHHPDTDMAEKARGAARRLSSVGKPWQLQGTGLNGSPVNLADLRGNLVVVHYWATWCEPCKQDIAQLRDLLGRFGRRKFAVVGVNLDDDPRAALTFLQQQKMAWPQLHDKGGLESNLAKQMGIFTLPVMLLVDEQGKVVNRSITLPELTSELAKRRGNDKRP